MTTEMHINRSGAWVSWNKYAGQIAGDDTVIVRGHLLLQRIEQS